MAGSIDMSVLSTYRVWAGTSIVGSFILNKFAPQYSVLHSYLMTAASIFSAICLVYYVYAVVIWPRFFSPMRHLPMPSGGSFFNGQFAAITKDASGIPLRRWINDIPNDGLIRYLHLFNHERLMVTSPKGLAEVLVTKSYDFVKPELLRSGIGAILGIGILFAEGDEHKVQRKNLMPAFSFRHIKELYPIFWSKSREMVGAIEAELQIIKPNTSQEMGEWASRATLDIIGVAGLGQDFNAISNPESELNKTYRSVFAPSRGAQILGMLQFFLPGWFLRALPMKRNNDVMAASKVARDTSRELVRLKKQRLAEKKEMQQDIISVALESGGFTEDELVNNMMTFLAAGHETTASAMTWAIYLMCQKPEVQHRLREEVRGHVESLSDHMDSNKLDGMPYLHAVCNEVLRLYSPVPLTLRDAAVDTTILGQFVPKGTKVILAPWAVNHSKELWGDDAGEFNPDRWMAPGQANSGGAVSNYAFLTFLHGPRSCIGQKFAVAELAALLAAFVGSFEFEMTEPDEEIIIKGGITARPRNGMRVNLTRIEGW
jgi:cytochrome P450